MATLKSSFADILRSPGMRKMIEASTLSEVARSSVLPSIFTNDGSRAMMLGDVLFKTPGDVRAVHSSLQHLHHPMVPRAANARVGLVQVLSKTISDRGMWRAGDPRTKQWPHMFPNRLAEQLVNNLIAMRILLRRPFRCDEKAADAWLSSTLLMMEPG